MIRSATIEDASAIATIYNRYIESTTITFEEAPVSREEIGTRIESVFQLGLPYLVAEYPDQDRNERNPGNTSFDSEQFNETSQRHSRIVAYAYAGKFRERSAYRHTVETAIYVAEGFQGQGIGTHLYSRLIEEVRSRKVHRAIAGITLPNPTSIALHEKICFKKVGVFSEVGFKFNQWLDVGFWELRLD